MMLYRREMTGFSLVEMMFTVTICIFVFGAIASFIASNLSIFKSVGQFHGVYNDARRTMQWVDRDIKESSDLISAVSIGGNSYTADSDTLVLRRDSVTGSDYDFAVYDLIKDQKNYLGNDTYRMDRTYYKAYLASGTATVNSSVSTRTVANDIVPPSGSGYIFQTSGKKVSVDLTVQRLERKAKETAVTYDGSSTGGGSSGNSSTQAALRLVSEVKMRN